METGDVTISTEDYHAGELIIDEELAVKMLAAVKRKTELELERIKRDIIQVAMQDDTIADIPVFEVSPPEE
jgi:hypothetical protein